MADKNHGEVTASLHAWGMQKRSDPTTRYATAEDVARADFLAAKGGRSVYIEAKCGTAGFAFSDWRPNQRQWALEWAIGTGTDYYLWLRLGTAGPHVLKNPMRKRSWLIPYFPMMDIISLVSPIQDTLPLMLTKHHALALREHQYDAVTLLAPYELTWAGSGKWECPEWHVFNKIYLKQPPLGVVTQRETAALLGALD